MNTTEAKYDCSFILFDNLRVEFVKLKFKLPFGHHSLIALTLTQRNTEIGKVMTMKNMEMMLKMVPQKAEPCSVIEFVVVK